MSRFIDVDFPNDERYVQGYTPEQVKHYEKCMASLPKYSDNFEILSDSDLKDAASDAAKIGGNATVWHMRLGLLVMALLVTPAAAAARATSSSCLPM